MLYVLLTPRRVEFSPQRYTRSTGTVEQLLHAGQEEYGTHVLKYEQPIPSFWAQATTQNPLYTPSEGHIEAPLNLLGLQGIGIEEPPVHQVRALLDLNGWVEGLSQITDLYKYFRH